MIKQKKTATFPSKQAAVLWEILTNRRLWFRLVILAFCVGIYYLFDWTFLIRLLRGSVAYVLNKLGHSTLIFNTGSKAFLTVDSKLFMFQPYCTYVDLFLVLLPFSWRYGKRLKTNILRLMVLACSIWVVNLVRVSLALSFYARGTSWAIAHTIPYGLFYFMAIAILSLMAIHRDLYNT